MRPPTRRSRTAAAAGSAPHGTLRGATVRSPGAPCAGGLRSRIEGLVGDLERIGADLELHARGALRRWPEEAAGLSSAAAEMWALARRLRTVRHFVPGTTHLVSDAGAGPRAGGSRPRGPDPAPGSLAAPLGGGSHGTEQR